MFRPLSIFIGLRYTRAKKRNHFISFISLTSMFGIALGVMVLITVLSVMNGFDEAIRERIFSMAAQVTIKPVEGALQNWPQLRSRLKQFTDITGTAPFVNGQALLSSQGQVSPAMILGVLPSQAKQVSEISKKVIQGAFEALQPGQFNIAMGQKLALNLGVSLGDKITVITPRAAVTPAGLIPTFKRFTVAAIFQVGNGSEFDNAIAFIQLNDAQKLFQTGSGVSGLQIKLRDLYQAPRFAEQLSRALPAEYQIQNWTQEYGSFFEAIKMEKTMIFLMLMLIIAVAAFNMVSTLVMVVTEKKADIAILRTLGASSRTIMSIFMVQGTIIGTIGTLLGLISGLLLAHHVTEFAAALEHFFHIQLVSSDVYYVNYLPSKVELRDVITVCGAAFILSILATLYPAWHAARIQPAEALRYE